MTDRQNPQTSQNLPSSSSKLTPETSKANSSSSGQKIRYPNPAETSIPDAATLREQWKFAIKQYSKWYSHAWGTAILAGLSFFALGWVIKGSNPLPSFKGDDSPAPSDDPDNSK
ncbi:hypothetical protein Pint_10489 [Pistacia integerrima]|uniref:Uncharacterized protein n=1 Tax=Pistacia integerrima TaxID=434235 RepID=A0ACC0XJE2_9ROSI|nr:hypothetical protein Pint_10489 [Pistacia integerrima]